MFSQYTSPEARVLKKANVQAFFAPIVDSPPRGFQGGIVLGDCESHRRLRHSRYWEPVDSFRADESNSEHIGKELTYIGPLYNHFGHTMSEFVHRILPSIHLEFPKKYLLIGELRGKNNKKTNIPSFFREILYFIGIDEDDIVILNSNGIIESLHVIEQGSDFGGGPKMGYLDHLDRFTLSRLDAIVGKPWEPRNTYVSRSNILHGGNILGERYIEHLLSQEGYFVMHPEEMPLPDQMQIYRSSRKLVFSEGSSCHGIEFFGNNSLNECHIIERRESHREIFSRIFRGRSRVFSSLVGAISLPSLVLDPTGVRRIEFLSNAFLPSRILISYFRTHGIAQLVEFDPVSYNKTIMEDFDRHIDFNSRSGARMAPQKEISNLRAALEHLCQATNVNVVG